MLSASRPRRRPQRRPFLLHAPWLVPCRLAMGARQPRTGAAAGERDHLCLISREPRAPNARGLMADAACTLPLPLGPVIDGAFRPPPPPTSQAASGCRSGRTLRPIWSRCFSADRSQSNGCEARAVRLPWALVHYGHNRFATLADSDRRYPALD